jgi:hypothetical protein
LSEPADVASGTGDFEFLMLNHFSMNMMRFLCLPKVDFGTFPGDKKIDGAHGAQ